jgi:hypothetical protein
LTSLLGLTVPAGYQWLLDRGLAGFEPFGQLQPWHYLLPDQCFWASDRWPSISEKRLLAYAKRQDCDDLACFVVASDDTVQGIVLIHGWTGAGFELCQEFPDFWSWLKHVVDDIGAWVSAGDC